MNLERVSYKSISIILLVALASLSIAHTLVSKLQYRDAAFRAQSASLSRVLEVASNESMRKLHEEAFIFGNTLQKRLLDPGTRQLLDERQLHEELEDLFINGFAGTRFIDLNKLRVYDLHFNLLAESGGSQQTSASGTPHFLLELARPRKGVDRLKAIGGLWQSPERPLYSLLLPIGGLRVSGYLEVVIDPAFNLGGISEITKLPIRITTIDDRTVFSSPALSGDMNELLAVVYLLRDGYGQPLYRVTAYENTSTFNAELQVTQYKTTLIFISIALILLLLGIYLLNRLLFRPVTRLISNMQHCMKGELDTSIDERGVKEVHLIARAFNVMVNTLRENMAELQRISSLDGLTGIANRRAFDERLDHEWSRAQRNQTPIALLLIDIDYFKAYNDSLGHQAGDRCLKEVAEILQNEMKRPGDMAARYGGEEFAVILPETDVFGAGVVALNIRNALHQKEITHPASCISTKITLSTGINVMIPGSCDTPQNLIEGADRALYDVKRNGRDGVRFAFDDQESLGGGEENAVSFK